ncbi:MAG: cytochrome C [Terriglobia bacterium]|nr:MAG: cytochrome C [Terriglobia bacterium]
MRGMKDFRSKPSVLYSSISLITLGAILSGGFLLLRPHRVAADTTSDDEVMRIKVGYAIAPVPLNVGNKDSALVGLGSYYVNAHAACADCHSCPTYAPGHNPYPPPVGVSGDGQMNAANYLAGGVPFTLPPPVGTIKSDNLTPNANGLPAGLTLQQFVTLMRTGTDPQGSKLYVMPWPEYRYMTDRDLLAIYTYLSAIPPAQPGSCVAPGQ